MIALHDLNLKGALSLLGHDASKPLPDQAGSATGFLQQVIDQLCELSLKDPLTGLANRRHFREVLNREIDVVARSGEPALLLMLDIDHFKKINDTYGHPAGDQVLQAIAQCLGNCVRPMDTVARYGGEEFAVILPSCQVAYGRVVADRIRESIEALSVQLSNQLELQVTVSIGGAFAPEWIRSTIALWTDRADSQLYRAKAEGRNRVCIDEQEEISVSAEEKSLLFGHLALDDAAWIDSVANDTPGDASRAAQS
ncbi:MAG: hypothetical protein RIS90_2263 [Pseudomonadota bacterium]|jgi:diguanylate cyclase (GGDEF)-like protein